MPASRRQDNTAWLSQAWSQQRGREGRRTGELFEYHIVSIHSIYIESVDLEYFHHQNIRTCKKKKPTVTSLESKATAGMGNDIVDAARTASERLWACSEVNEQTDVPVCLPRSGLYVVYCPGPKTTLPGCYRHGRSGGERRGDGRMSWLVVYTIYTMCGLRKFSPKK